jgi:hypothetical protein
MLSGCELVNGAEFKLRVLLLLYVGLRTVFYFFDRRCGRKPMDEQEPYVASLRNEPTTVH